MNTLGTLSVLEAARKNRVRRVVFAGAAAVYGDDPELPKTESSPVPPLLPYAWHKLTGEFYGRCYHDQHDIEFVSLRYFNIYGPRQDPSSPYSGVLSIFGDRSLRKEPLTIYGDGGQTRDFVQVSDVATINLDAMLSDSRLPDIINVATGIDATITDVARLIQEACGSEAGINHNDKRAGDIYRSYASGRLMVDTFGHGAAVSVRDGIKALVDERRKP